MNLKNLKFTGLTLIFSSMFTFRNLQSFSAAWGPEIKVIIFFSSCFWAYFPKSIEFLEHLRNRVSGKFVSWNLNSLEIELEINLPKTVYFLFRVWTLAIFRKSSSK